MTLPTVELVMSEFGNARQNAGGARLDPAKRLNPALRTFRTLFPEALVTVRSDVPLDVPPGVRLERVSAPFDPQEERYGWRAHDYFQAVGLLESRADFAIAMDADMEIVSDRFRAILPIAEAYGLAVPLNGRLLLGVDGSVGVDSTYRPEEDPTSGTATTYNLTPIAFSTRHTDARRLLEVYRDRMAEQPGRGAVHLCEASFETRFQPYPLSFPWCVCSPRDLDSPHQWREAIALHVGHADVRPRWEREPAIAKRQARHARVGALARRLLRGLRR